MNSIKKRSPWIKVIILIVAALVILGLAFLYSDAALSPSEPDEGDTSGDVLGSYHRISAEEVKNIIEGEESYILLDVRSEEEYKAKRIDGAILIPDYEIAARAATELPDKDAMIILYCQSGLRSAAVAELLADMGYTQVYNLGGIIYWPHDTVSDIE